MEEELGEILDARTPLLQRAFRNAKPITEDDTGDPGDKDEKDER